MANPKGLSGRPEVPALLRPLRIGPAPPAASPVVTVVTNTVEHPTALRSEGRVACAFSFHRSRPVSTALPSDPVTVRKLRARAVGQARGTGPRAASPARLRVPAAGASRPRRGQAPGAGSWSNSHFHGQIPVGQSTVLMSPDSGATAALDRWASGLVAGSVGSAEAS